MSRCLLGESDSASVIKKKKKKKKDNNMTNYSYYGYYYDYYVSGIYTPTQNILTANKFRTLKQPKYILL